MAIYKQQSAANIQKIYIIKNGIYFKLHHGVGENLELCNGMLFGNPARPMLFASVELTAALKFQRQRQHSVPFPIRDKKK